MEQTQFSSPTPSSSNTSFLVLALSILGILAISLLLLLYYLFITKCCQLSWYRYSTNIVSRRRSQYNNNPTLQSTSVIERRGLDESSIQSIPTIRYKKSGDKISFHECAVCINEFREEERIRLLPNCFHVFHLDCIDTWLQSNANCPLCRAPITCCPMAMAHLVGPYGQEGANDNNSDIVIHVRDNELSVNDERKLKNVGSMGDECINSRNKEDLFDIVPMRRSFSMDSSSDRQLYIAVQNILHGSSQTRRDIPVRENNGDENNVPGKLRRGFFSFNQNRPLRSAVLPI